MCLAIFKPADKPVPVENLKGGWQSNPGGAGFAYVKKGKVVVEKGFMKLQDFLTAYDAAAKKNKKSPFIIHFRIPSMGHSGVDNTHPFTFAHGALIHNGTIYGTGAMHGTGPSDTAKFAERYSDKLTWDNVEKNKKKIDEALGYNKIVLLYPNATHQILNEGDGTWQDGVWYSNRFFMSMAQRMGRSCDT